MAGPKADEPLLAALAAGEEVAAAAHLAGVSERTAYRRLADPTFAHRLAAVRAAMLTRTAGTLAQATTAAVATLVRNLEADTAAVQVRAAVALLDQAVKLRESEELARRVAELEARVAPAPQSQSQSQSQEEHGGTGPDDAT